MSGGGEFQPQFQTGFMSGGAHRIRLCPLRQLSFAAAGLGQLCQLKDMIEFIDYTLNDLRTATVQKNIT